MPMTLRGNGSALGHERWRRRATLMQTDFPGRRRPVPAPSTQPTTGRPSVTVYSAVPAARGLYDPAAEHDSCGVAFVVDARGRRSRRIVELGPTARSVMPAFAQLFVAGADEESGLPLERRAFCIRKRIEYATPIYFPSLSSRTLVYKGMLTTAQLPTFFPDITDERLESAIALVHSRFSTNTFPSWPLAHPFRFVAHNGEINTIRGNRNRMRAREALLGSDLIAGDLTRLYPICDPDGSDSASFD